MREPLQVANPLYDFDRNNSLLQRVLYSVMGLCAVLHQHGNFYAILVKPLDIRTLNPAYTIVESYLAGS